MTPRSGTKSRHLVHLLRPEPVGLHHRNSDVAAGSPDRPHMGLRAQAGGQVRALRAEVARLEALPPDVDRWLDTQHEGRLDDPPSPTTPRAGSGSSRERYEKTTLNEHPAPARYDGLGRGTAADASIPAARACLPKIGVDGRDC